MDSDMLVKITNVHRVVMLTIINNSQHKNMQYVTNVLAFFFKKGPWKLNNIPGNNKSPKLCSQTRFFQNLKICFNLYIFLIFECTDSLFKITLICCT